MGTIPSPSVTVIRNLVMVSLTNAKMKGFVSVEEPFAEQH